MIEYLPYALFPIGYLIGVVSRDAEPLEKKCRDLEKELSVALAASDHIRANFTSLRSVERSSLALLRATARKNEAKTKVSELQTKLNDLQTELDHCQASK